MTCCFDQNVHPALVAQIQNIQQVELLLTDQTNEVCNQQSWERHSPVQKRPPNELYACLTVLIAFNQCLLEVRSFAIVPSPVQCGTTCCQQVITPSYRNELHSLRSVSTFKKRP